MPPLLPPLLLLPLATSTAAPTMVDFESKDGATTKGDTATTGFSMGAITSKKAPTNPLPPLLLLLLPISLTLLALSLLPPLLLLPFTLIVEFEKDLSNEDDDKGDGCTSTSGTAGLTGAMTLKNALTNPPPPPDDDDDDDDGGGGGGGRGGC